jgi:hypothetical protein
MVIGMMSEFGALFGLHAMSDLSPECATWANQCDFLGVASLAQALGL